MNFCDFFFLKMICANTSCMSLTHENSKYCEKHCYSNECVGIHCNSFNCDLPTRNDSAFCPKHTNSENLSVCRHFKCNFEIYQNNECFESIDSCNFTECHGKKTHFGYCGIAHCMDKEHGHCDKFGCGLTEEHRHFRNHCNTLECSTSHCKKHCLSDKCEVKHCAVHNCEETEPYVCKNLKFATSEYIYYCISHCANENHGHCVFNGCTNDKKECIEHKEKNNQN